jgi:8-amino-7-oxononanoate synthase
MYNDDFLLHKLNERKSNNAFRSLHATKYSIDFCSNDYLGIVKNNLIHVNQTLAHGSAGSRLLAGNNILTQQLESQLAQFHQAPAALIFNSGYDANIGLLSCVPQKGDTIFYDYLCHASIRDGIRLSFATAYSFEHNNVNDLEKKLQLATGNIFIVTESVFSMDGDVAPLQQIVELSKKYKAHIVIDEAHAIGVIGQKGVGLAQHLQLHQQIFARVYTYGKACGVHGALVVGSTNLINYCINFSRSFIYSTALPPSSIAAIKKSYEIFPLQETERHHIAQLIKYFQQQQIKYKTISSTTPIQAVIIPNNVEVKHKANQLQQQGMDVRPIVYPTVPKGTERLRIILHSFNTFEEIDKLVEVLNQS